MTKKRGGKKAPAPAGPPIGVVTVAKRMGLEPKEVRDWIRQGAPVVGEKAPETFVSYEAVHQWVADGWRQARHLGHAERSTKGMAGRWALFVREGWASFACETCERGDVRPFETKRRLGIGDHVQARIERVTITKGGPVAWVLVRCWCSARVGKIRLAWVPEHQHELIPYEASVSERVGFSARVR